MDKTNIFFKSMCQEEKKQIINKVEKKHISDETIKQWLAEYDSIMQTIDKLYEKDKTIDDCIEELYDCLPLDFFEIIWKKEISYKWLFEDKDRIKKIITIKEFMLHKISNYIPYEYTKKDINE